MKFYRIKQFCCLINLGLNLIGVAYLWGNCFIFFIFYLLYFFRCYYWLVNRSKILLAKDFNARARILSLGYLMLLLICEQVQDSISKGLQCRWKDLLYRLSKSHIMVCPNKENCQICTDLGSYYSRLPGKSHLDYSRVSADLNYSIKLMTLLRQFSLCGFVKYLFQKLQCFKFRRFRCIYAFNRTVPFKCLTILILFRLIETGSLWCN